MTKLDEEQQEALRKFKRDVLGVPAEETKGNVERYHRGEKRPQATNVKRTSSLAASGEVTLLADIARETGLKVQDVIRECRRTGIQLDSKPRQTPLLPEEAEHLRRFAPRFRKKQPITTAAYKPSPKGRINLKDYDRLEPDLLASLLAAGYLPSRSDVVRFPNRSWAAILRHHRLTDLLDAERSRASRAAMQRYAAAQEVRPRSGRAQAGSPSVVEKTSGARAAAISDPVVAEIKRQLDARRHRREMNPESKPEPAGIQISMPPGNSLETTIGQGSQALQELQLTLSAFAPKDHPVLFRCLNAALDLDERIVRSFGDEEASRLTEPALRHLIRDVCSGNFGLFAYHEVSNTLRSAARRNSLAMSQVAMKNALMKLRPMFTGVMTDAGKSRFVFWRIEQSATQLTIVTFGAISDWVQGMSSGQYIPLRGRLVTVARDQELTRLDREDAQFMVEAALKLRKGIHVRHSSPSAALPSARNYLAGPSSPPNRALRYKPHSDWLIPVTVEDGVATAGLEEGFFSNYGGKSAHQVRPFMRRAPGTSWNAPKTVAVSAHTRGGYEVGDIGFMPTVTIMRELSRPFT